MPIYTPAAAAFEIHSTRSETITRDSGVTASVTLRCHWNDRYTVMTDIVGNRREWPFPITNAPGAESPRAFSAACTPEPACYTQDGQSMTYSNALIALQYGSEEADLITESLEPQAQFITLDHAQFRWAAQDGDLLEEEEAPGRLLVSLNVIRTIHDFDGDLPIELLNLVGHCNVAQYASSLLGLNFPAETLMYSPPTLSRKITTKGIKGWDIQLKLGYKPDGWNKFWRPKSDDYAEIFHVSDATAHKIHPTGDFTKILFDAAAQE